MTRLATIFIFSLLLTVSAFAQSSVKVGSTAPAFSGTSIEGTPFDLRDLRGSVVVVTFWSTRCAICQAELPNLNRIARRHDSKEIVFLALSMENEHTISGFLRKNPFRFNLLPNSFGVVLQYADRDRHGRLDMGFPSYFVIDQDGIVQHRSSGYGKTEPLEAAINKLSKIVPERISGGAQVVKY